MYSLIQFNNYNLLIAISTHLITFNVFLKVLTININIICKPILYALANFTW